MVNRDAAREETDREEDRSAQNVPGLRASGALAGIKQIRHDENREHRRFRGDQAVHADAAGLHSYRQSGSSGCLMSQSGRRLFTVGSTAKLYSGGGAGV